MAAHGCNASLAEQAVEKRHIVHSPHPRLWRKLAVCHRIACCCVVCSPRSMLCMLSSIYAPLQATFRLHRIMNSSASQTWPSHQYNDYCDNQPLHSPASPCFLHAYCGSLNPFLCLSFHHASNSTFQLRRHFVSLASLPPCVSLEAGTAVPVPVRTCP
jgi:hypothetical protein